MAAVGSTYRGTREYQLVYCRLLNGAQNSSLVSYAEISDILDALATDHDATPDVGHLLGEISADEHHASRPMLTALVVTGKGIPGDVFFSLARSLGKLQSAEPAEEMKFWMAEKGKVYETWKRGS